MSELELLRDFYDAWIGYHTSPMAERQVYAERLMSVHNLLQAHYGKTEVKGAGLYLPERLNG